MDIGQRRVAKALQHLNLILVRLGLLLPEEILRRGGRRRRRRGGPILNRGAIMRHWWWQGGWGVGVWWAAHSTLSPCYPVELWACLLHWLSCFCCCFSSNPIGNNNSASISIHLQSILLYISIYQTLALNNRSVLDLTVEKGAQSPLMSVLEAQEDRGHSCPHRRDHRKGRKLIPKSQFYPVQCPLITAADFNHKLHHHNWTNCLSSVCDDVYSMGCVTVL